MEHLPDARSCRVSWAMVAEVAQWGTPICPRVGVSCLMSAVSLSYCLRQLMSVRRGIASLAESCPSVFSPRTYVVERH